MTSRLDAGRIVPAKQQGIVLFVALIVLVIMSLTGIALMRQMGSAQIIAANLSFKQSATSSADRGVEAARAFIRDPASNATVLEANQSAQGYFASTATAFDPLTYNWGAANAAVTLASDTAGNTVQYVVHRLCPAVGAIESQLCTNVVTNVGGSKGGASYGGETLPPSQQPYFRVTTRVAGPRNTLSYTQVVLY